MMTIAEQTNSLKRGGCIILIDVPLGSSITLDGITRITPSLSSSSSSSASASSSTSLGAFSAQSTPFQRGLWIISNVACSTSTTTSSSEDFHLLIVRSGTNKDANKGNNHSSGDCVTLPVGFVLGSPERKSISTDLGCDWIFARRYDPTTEEISNESVDELTLKNLILAMKEGGELGKFVIPYDQFIGSTASNNNNNNNGDDGKNNKALPSWEARTSMINVKFLQRRHGFSHGDKIVPSSEEEEGDDGKNSTTATISKNNSTKNNDGTSVSYPPIPCIDPMINARRLAQHSGTRKYLSKLSPEKRTWLLLGSSGDSGTETMNSGEYVWKDALCRYYGRTDVTCRESEHDFLADVQLSFLLFLFLQCHASLEHWRDAVSMCSLSTATAATTTATTAEASTSTSTTTNIVIQHPNFFHELLTVLCDQLSCIETEFFREVEYSAGENNFMVGALRRMCDACESVVGKRKRGGDVMLESVKSTSQRLRCLVRERFGLDLTLQKGNDVDDDDMEIDAFDETIDEVDGDGCDKSDTNEIYDNQEEDDDDEDGPVMIPYDQIEASLARSTLQSSRAPKRDNEQMKQSHCKEYPLLYAAMIPEEDEVMACARILDEAKDVSLVREAAAYLEVVEAHRGGFY